MEQTVFFMPKPVVIPVSPEQEIPTQAELESIKKGLEDVKAGRTHAMLDGESLDNFLIRVGHVQD